MRGKRFERITTGLVLLLTLCGYGVWGHISQNSRQGSGLVFSVSPQGVEALQAGTDARFSLDTATIKHPSILLHRNRYYNPTVGRFVSRDPIGFAGGSNLWGYAGRNPVSRADPSGTLDVLAFDDTEPTLAHAGIRHWWYLDYPVILRTSKYSTADEFLWAVYQASQMEPITRFIYLGHGSPHRLALPKTAVEMLPMCLPEYPIHFAGNGIAIFFSCFTGEGQGTLNYDLFHKDFPLNYPFDPDPFGETSFAATFSKGYRVKTVGNLGKGATNIIGYMVENTSHKWVTQEDLAKYPANRGYREAMSWARLAVWKRIFWP